ncbi:hypothetical protein UFOVP1615_18 [uncultured Caudovirales phage]|jgi:hypothetical protein|uniref:Uncharacterized protein n=1 Tax=uncultured Caudovirales phage TaxID=2100421 RepID=A0A6J5SX33_9CAUD|nr:hypothetical protein UFOVP1615_18 [uncultured Caudovirales phage]
MNGKCNCCEQHKDLRLGFCFECCELESIIADGTDMYNNEIPKNEGLSQSMNKLKYIIIKLKPQGGNTK